MAIDGYKGQVGVQRRTSGHHNGCLDGLGALQAQWLQRLSHVVGTASLYPNNEGLESTCMWNLYLREWSMATNNKSVGNEQSKWCNTLDKALSRAE